MNAENPNVIPVESYYVHEGYDPNNQYINDIAVIKLVRPIQNDLHDWKVKLAVLGAYYPTGTPAVLAGKI